MKNFSKSTFRNFSKSTILGLTLGVFLAAYSAFAAWAPPTVVPPGGNVAAPVNIGANNQIKIGGLWVNSFGTDGGAIFGADLTVTGVISGVSNLILRAGGTATGPGNNASIYFTAPDGEVRGRLDTALVGEGILTVVEGTTAVNTVATTLTSSGISSGQSILAVDSTSGFTQDDIVLIMQMKGGSMAAGTYELKTIQSIDTSTQMTLSSSVANSYSHTTPGTCITDCAQVVRIPRYTKIILTVGTLTAPAWSASTGTGGILWVESMGDVSISSGFTITMDSKGYFSGTGPGTGSAGISAGSSGVDATDEESGGGGGAGGTGGGGGGAGYSSTGTGGTAGVSGAGGRSGLNSRYHSGGVGGTGAGGSGGSSVTATFTSRIPMGSGGGAGAVGIVGGDGSTFSWGVVPGGTGGNGGSGGTGGGIIVIHSGTSISNSGTITTKGTNGANGGTGGTGQSFDFGGGGGGSGGAGGGGGTGGSIWMNAPTVTAGTFTIMGGLGGSGGNGGNGGAGYRGPGGGGAGITGGQPGACGAQCNGVGQSGANAAPGIGGAGASGRSDITTNISLISTRLYGVLYIASTNTVGADVAEMYRVFDPTIEAGDIVEFSEQDGLVVLVKARNSKDGQKISTLAGVISTKAGILLGDGDASSQIVDNRALALVGRVPVKISTENGSISIGDRITLSSSEGVGMRATKDGNTIGMALEPYSGEGTGTIMIFVNLGYQRIER